MFVILMMVVIFAVLATVSKVVVESIIDKKTGEKRSIKEMIFD